jgi:hypothetical protein
MGATMRPATLLKAAILLSGVALAYRKFVRPGVINWGATEAEAQSTLPGDDILSDVNLQTTRAVTIDASPERVWPWLVQMGPRPRAGVYTYDWLERLLGIDIENANRILPEFQHLEPDQFFVLGDGGNGLHVREVLPERALVLQWHNEQSTWAFVLNRTGENRTRLISRNRIIGAGPGFAVGMAFMEPASLIMERKMLLGIKQRAERLKETPAIASNVSSNGH